MDSFMTDFLSQLPLGLIINVCGLGLLFAGLLVYLYYIRPRRKKAAALAAEQAANTDPQYDDYDSGVPAASARKFDTGQLPDLDLLLTSSAAPPPPAAPPPAAPEARRHTPGGVIEMALEGGTMTDAKELVTVLRDEDDGRLIVLIGDRAFRSLIDAPEAKHEFVKIMKELSEVVTRDDPRPAGDYRKYREEAAPPPQQTSRPMIEETDMNALRGMADDMDAEMDAAPEEELPNLGELLTPPPPIEPSRPLPSMEGNMPGDLPSYKLDDVPVKEERGGLFGQKRKVKYEALPEVNVAQAIEDYLQHKLAYTPELQGRGIHVRSGMGGMIRIDVDGRSYDAVDQVTDPQVRQFLAVTIQEWQDRQ